MQLNAFIDSIFINKEDINIIIDIFTDVYSMPGLVQYVHNYCCFLPAGDLNEFSPTHTQHTECLQINISQKAAAD